MSTKETPVKRKVIKRPTSKRGMAEVKEISSKSKLGEDAKGIDSFLEKMNKLAKMKKKIKADEVAIDLLQAELVVDAKKGEKYKTPSGTLSLGARDTYAIKDKAAVVKEMGTKLYQEFSTISKKGVEDAVGSRGFEKLIEAGAFELTKTSVFLTLRK